MITGGALQFEWGGTRVQDSKFNVKGPKRIETLNLEH
jgi:hypothetical protein